MRSRLRSRTGDQRRRIASNPAPGPRSARKSKLLVRFLQRIAIGRRPAATETGIRHPASALKFTSNILRKLRSVFGKQSDRPPQKRRPQKRRNPLRPMIRKRIQPNLSIRLPVQRRNVPHRHRISLRRFRSAIQIHNLHARGSRRPRLQPIALQLPDTSSRRPPLQPLSASAIPTPDDGHVRNATLPQLLITTFGRNVRITRTMSSKT